MKRLFIISVLFNIILGFAVWNQMGTVEDLTDSNVTLANHIKDINSEQLRVTSVAQAIQARSSRIHPAMAKHYAGMYIRAGKKYDIDPILLVRVGGVESAFRHNAVSYMGAIGLQQIMPKYWANGEIPFVKSARDLFNPAINIHASAFILSYYIRTGGGTAAGVRQYHGGFRAIKNPRAITVQYQRDVLRGYNSA